MIHRKALGAPAIAVLIVVSGCDGRGSPVSTEPPVPFTIAGGRAPLFSETSARAGVLHATKACPDYHGNAGEFCSITSSNVHMIDSGAKVVYARGIVDGKLDSDLTLVPPGNGKSVAFGHVTLDFTATPLRGIVTFSGGTGKFKQFSATLDVFPLNRLQPDFVNWTWDGPYSFAKDDDNR
jgi:hypothetical protein